MRRFGSLLDEYREVINRLNVYPVPDGDTGTNMALTVASVVQELDGDRRVRFDARGVPGRRARLA